MKILLVMSICAAFIVPSVASAGEIPNPLVKEMRLERGDYTLPSDFARSSGSMKLNPKTTKVEFVVENGEPSGENWVSSVKIDVLDENGKKVATPISPKQFNQSFSNGVGSLSEDDIKGLTELKLDIKVRGPKGGFIVLNVTEYYEDDVGGCVEVPRWADGYPICQ